jgi:hypothetical protein
LSLPVNQADSQIYQLSISIYIPEPGIVVAWVGLNKRSLIAVVRYLFEKAYLPLLLPWLDKWTCVGFF